MRLFDDEKSKTDKHDDHASDEHKTSDDGHGATEHAG